MWLLVGYFGVCAYTMCVPMEMSKTMPIHKKVQYWFSIQLKKMTKVMFGKDDKIFGLLSTNEITHPINQYGDCLREGLIHMQIFWKISINQVNVSEEGRYQEKRECLRERGISTLEKSHWYLSLHNSFAETKEDKWRSSNHYWID